MDKKGFILHEKGLGYYGGQHKKYYDMFNLTGKEGAEVLSEEDAMRIKDKFKKAGYRFEVEESN